MNIRSLTKRVDSWYNAITGLGNALRDKVSHTYFTASHRIPDEMLDNLYHQEDVAARICDALPNDALRKGHYLSAEADDPELSAALKQYNKRVKFENALSECAVWSRVFGGACIYLGLDDGQAEDQPVNIERLQAIRFATVLDKRHLYPKTWYADLDRYGCPELYEIQAPPTIGNNLQESELKTGTLVHESRLIRLDGTRTSFRRAQHNNGWHDSVLEKCHNVIRDFGANWAAVSHLMQDAAQGVFKIKGLMEMIASGDADILNSRMELVDMSRSVARAIMVDADSEDFERKAYTFQGIPEVLKLFMVRLSLAADMPVSILMGSKVITSSLSDSGGSEDTRRWYDKVQTYQTKTLTPAIEQYYELMFQAKDFLGQEPDSWEVLYNRLWQMTDAEQAELEKHVAERDRIYIETGVLLPEEVAINRFKVRGFSSETQIDMDARQEMLDAEMQLAKDQAGEPAPVLPTVDPGTDPEE